MCWFIQPKFITSSSSSESACKFFIVFHFITDFGERFLSESLLCHFLSLHSQPRRCRSQKLQMTSSKFCFHYFQRVNATSCSLHLRILLLPFFVTWTCLKPSLVVRCPFSFTTAFSSFCTLFHQLIVVNFKESFSSLRGKEMPYLYIYKHSCYSLDR